MDHIRNIGSHWKSRVLIFAAFVSMGASCKKDPNYEPDSVELLHISHTRLDRFSGQRIIPEAEMLNYDNYEVLMLGGDLTYTSSASLDVLKYLDSVFNLRRAETLWAMGNHDYSNPNLIESYTQKPLSYAQQKDGITYIVLDTQDSVSNVTGTQLELIRNVINHLDPTGYLILLHHQLIWLRGHPDLEVLADSISNGPLGTCGYCINPNNFYADVYPLLIEATEKGVQVICIGGDIGAKAKDFEYITKDGIVFLASGVQAGTAGNKVLVFKHDRIRNQLTWQFQPL